VLLFVEWAWVEVDSEYLDIWHEFCPTRTHGVGNQLYDGAGNRDHSVMLVKENIYRTNNGADNKTYGPRTDGINILARVIGGVYLTLN
jgi:hypothetical protein